MSARQIEEWILWKTIEAEDEQKAYKQANTPTPSRANDDDEEE